MRKAVSRKDSSWLSVADSHVMNNRIKATEALSNSADFNYANLATVTINDSPGGALFRANSAPASTSF